MSPISTAEISLKTFRQNLDGDEEMMRFAAETMDEAEDRRVLITIDGQLVTFELLPECRPWISTDERKTLAN